MITETSEYTADTAARSSAPIASGSAGGALGVGAMTLAVSGSPFVLTQITPAIIQLTVDDGGSLCVHHTESGTDYTLSATLPPGEWPLLNNADYWQSSLSADLPVGHYTVSGSVTNVPFANGDNSENQILLRYRIDYAEGTSGGGGEGGGTGDEPSVPTRPDAPGEEPRICCDCCSCTEQDGNANIIATVDLPGASFIDRCFLKAYFEASAAGSAVPTAADEPGAVPPYTFGLRLSSVWAWRAAQSDAVITITPPASDALYFAVTPGSATARLCGEARRYAFALQLLDAEGAPCTEGEPAFWLLVDDEGNRVYFSVLDGRVESVRTASGRLITAADFAAQVQVLEDSNGFIRSAYCATDGFMRATLRPDGATMLCEWFAPSQVQVSTAEDGINPLYETTGSPFRTESFCHTVADGVQTTCITRQQGELPAHTVTRVQDGELTTITRGSGSSAAVRSIRRTWLGNGEFEIIESQHRIGEQTPASCSRELMLHTQGGWLLLERTEGYGSAVAQTTAYEYDSAFRLARRKRPDGSVTRYEYDSEGRRVLAAAPWAGGFERLTRTTYADLRFFDNRPAVETVAYITANGEEKSYSTLTRTYEDSAVSEKVTTVLTAAGSSQSQLSMEETWAEQAPYPYAAGKLKLTQDASGIRTAYSYAATSLYGALHRVSMTRTAPDDALSAGQSRRTELYIAADDTLRCEREYVWNGSRWLLLSSAEHEYDAQQRCTKTTRGNGRFSTTEWMCAGKLRETDEDGITTTYGYDSARHLVETIRSEVKDGELVITPETITTYTRDAAGRVLTTRRDVGAMSSVESTAYDSLGRVIRRTDTLGRTTLTTYSADGLTTTVTTPAGATLTTRHHPDGSVLSLSGSGQRELHYAYDMSGNNLRTTVKNAAGAIISQSIVNGFGQTVVEARASTTGFIYRRLEYDTFGRQVKSYEDTGWNTARTAATLLEYDAFGNITKQTLALSSSPTAANSPMLELAYGVEELADGIYATTTETTYNAAGFPLVSVQKELISELSPTLESKNLTIDNRGLTSVEWTEYNGTTKRTTYSSLPMSDITAEAVSADGFVRSQKDHAGVTTTATRSYTATGMSLTQTDGRGNSTTTLTDIAGRELSYTDGAGNTSTTLYDAVHDLPATVTDAAGNTSCYRYDARGRKIAEWGSGICPATFSYDDADRMTSLTTFRCPDAVITTDPSEYTDADVTTRSYHDASGMEIARTYADNSSVTRTYDAYNRVLTETDARGNVKTHTYEPARGLLLGTTYSNGDTPRTYTYNHLGQLTQVTDAAGVRTLSYNTCGEQESDSLVADGVTHLITETRDDKGRSTGYTYAKNGVVQQTVTTGYGTDGRINSAGFLHGGVAKQFGYEYLAGSHLLEQLTMPNNMTLTQSCEIQRDLLTGMAYRRGTTLVANRQYSYDPLGRPISRTTSRQGTVMNDTFGYNTRSELTTATVSGSNYAYDYDNIGNRETATESDITTNYTANELNQYTAVGDFTPTFDADGNQTLVKTTTGTWSVTYDAENRPVSFTNAETNTVIECAYDHMGRRATKKVTVDGSITLHQRYLYRGYLQIACCDLTRANHPCLWLITWDPTQPVATRPLAIQKDGTWYTYGWDLTKNICELYGSNGYIRTAYTYSPYGQVTATGNVTQPIQWSSEYHDTELGLVYYNYRHYNPLDGRWVGRDRISKGDYVYCNNAPCKAYDRYGLDAKKIGKIDDLELRAEVETNGPRGQSSFHIHIGDDKYDYRNDRDLPGFYDRKTGKPLSNKIKKRLRRMEEWRNIMDKAECLVDNNGGLSRKFGGGKIIKGCVSIVFALECAKMLDDYVKAMKSGSLQEMDDVFHDFMAHACDLGTLGRGLIFEDARKFHDDMKSYASRNLKSD